MPIAPDRGSNDLSRDEVVIAAIGVEIRQIQALHHGHIPTSARTIWHEDIVVCLLQGIFTPAETDRVADGEFAGVRTERLGRRDALEPIYRALVETLTGRPVRAYMSEVGPDDVAFEAFVLG
jgi:uncharacterized protein YbcI